MSRGKGVILIDAMVGVVVLGTVSVVLLAGWIRWGRHSVERERVEAARSRLSAELARTPLRKRDGEWVPIPSPASVECGIVVRFEVGTDVGWLIASIEVGGRVVSARRPIVRPGLR